MKPTTFREIDGNSKGYYSLLGLLGLMVAAGLGAAITWNTTATGSPA